MNSNLRIAIGLLVFGFLALAVSFGIRSVFGFFLVPYHQSTGISIATLSMVFAVQNLVWGMAQPFTGAWADTRGATPVILTGSVIYTIGILLMAFSDNPWVVGLGGGVMVGFGISSVGFPVVMGAVGRAVSVEKRSLFFGIATAGGSFGQAIFAPIGQGLLDRYGPSTALVGLAIFCGLIAMLSLGLWRDKGAQQGPKAHIEDKPAIPLRTIVRDAMGHPGYVLLTTGFFVCGFQLAFMTIHLPPYIVQCGLSADVGVMAIALIGVFNIAGTLLAGWAGNLWRPKFPLSSIYFLRALATVLFLLFPASVWSVALFSAAMGLLWLSTVPLTTSVVANMYGPWYVGTLFGIVFFSHQVGSFVGLWIAGETFEATGSYDLVWWLSVALAVFAGLVHLPINDSRKTVSA